MSADVHVLRCPLCGLRYHHRSELELHARDDHARVVVPEGQLTLHVRPGPGGRWPAPTPRPPLRGLHGRRA